MPFFKSGSNSMKKRTKVIVNKDFQLKTAFSLIGLIFLIFSIIISLIGINAVVNNKNLEKIANSEIALMSTQVEMFKSLVNASKERQWEDLIRSTDEISRKLNINTIAVNQNVSKIKDITFMNNALILAIVIFTLLQGIILYYILIRKTHKITGPIELMSNHFRDLIDGKFPTIRPLREKDEFADFYQLFGQVLDKLKERESGNKEND